ncbi:amino acid adenylation domain-containing protein [Clostridium estertheticum]|uniref:non-ribosomal peptide synthetase n=1 Tax=Clostridium estertheticum TaxID=238834 RepID=UPI001C7DEAEA|nr:non-ribosomal peptide synthetase [Clostridium estertheticum]MBX4262444.1 amino acid adenylation domain-containing protein [Clostridium estertheticum]WLC72232.1 amino acid adenylation domain-containing protein [Clostridium estertheticum]
MYINEKNGADIKTQVYELISNITGHKTLDLDCEMFLESDLGIDSIKMVTLMNGLMKSVPAEELENFTSKYPITYLMSLQTIGEIVIMFEGFYNMETSSQDETDELIILNSQYPFLISYWSVGTLTICSGVKMEGPLHLEVLQESWIELVKRHPSLCSVFKASDESKSFKDYKLEVYTNPILPEIEVLDIRNLPEEVINKTIKKTIEGILNKPFDIFEYPLHKFMIIRINNTQYELILSNNHLVSDGLGNQQILKEMLEIYCANLQGVDSNLPDVIKASDYNKVVSEINNFNDPKEYKNLEKYTQTWGKTKYRFNPFSKNNIENEFAQIKTQKYWISETVTNLLLDKSKAWRVSLFSILVSAYLKSIAQLDEKSNQTILNLPTGGKVYPSVDATGLIGCFAQNMSLTFNLNHSGNDWETLVKNVDEEIKDNISSGIDRAQTFITAQMAKEQDMLEHGKMPKTTAAIVRSTLKSNLYLSFVGNTKIKERYGDLKIIDYEAYTSTNVETIDNLIELFQNKILITSNYDSLHFSGDNINILINKFIDNLNSLAECKIVVKDKILSSKISQDKILLEELETIAQEVCCTNICSDDIHKDLESEFGVDSLQLIRIITRISKQHVGVDKNSLFGCRTLNEMASIIEKDGSVNDEKGDLKENYSEEKEQIPFMQIMKQCKLTPDAAAIMYNDEIITYKELDCISNKLANYLQTQGIKKGSLVGIMVFPGPIMLIGMIGIMKAGAAYVPVDPAYPTDRVQYILSNSGIEVMLTENALKEQLGELIKDESSIKTVLYLDYGETTSSTYKYKQVSKEQWIEASDIEPKFINSPDDLMTVLYTSGSTGNPKGVMLGHRGYMNRLKWHQDTFKLKIGERVAQKTSCCFDISVWELFWPLMYGGTVCPVRKEIVKNPWGLAKWLIDTKINIMHFVPSLFGEFVNAIDDDNYNFKDLRWLIFSGEALPMPIIQKWIDKHGLGIGLANLYGPTEASIDVTCHIIDKRPGSNGENSIPIGKPIENVFIKNLDKNMNELPDGEIGELWIGGVQLAKGYLNNRQKTEEAFKPNPFKGIPGEYLYRTGDLTTRRADRSYDYLGRIDNQVKIRGFRVELGEIEAVLGGHSCVDEAAVIAVDYIEGQKQLIAWLAGDKVTDSELKECISKKLPYYMIPHHFEWINVLPKTPNGKLDRKALIELSQRKLKGKGTNELAVNEISLSPAQNWLMSYFDYPYQWTGYTRFLYKQPLDYTLFNRALSIVTNSRDALRSVLVDKDGKWLQKFLPQDQMVEADFYDGSHMNNEERNNEVKNLIDTIISGLKVDKWPLWKVVVIKVNESLYDISVIGHHLISDVITNQLLFKDIWKIYEQLILGNKDVKLEKSKSYKDFVLQVNEEKNEKCFEFVDYYKKQFPSEAYSFKIPTDFNLGDNTEESTRIEKFKLDKAETKILLTTAKKCFGANVYPIILAPLYKMLQKQYNKSWVVVSHRMNGRDLGNNNTFFETAGNFAINYPLGISIGDNEDWYETVQKIENGMNSVPFKGISYDLVSDNLPAYLYPDLKLTSIRANYLGNRDIPEYNVFEFSVDGTDRRYSHPKQKRISSIEFFFSIVSGELNLEIEYSKNMYNAATIMQLGNQYIKATKEMFSYTNNRENSQEHSTLKPLSLIKENKKHGILFGKVAIITGGGRGIGRTIAIEMAKEDAQIVIISRTSSELEETTLEIQTIGGKVISIRTDISDYKAVSDAVDKVISTFGKIDILVNNAGITKMDSFTDMSEEEWKRIVEVNLFGSFNMCHVVIPYLVNQKSGKIINLGSDSSFIGYPLMSAYTASKHAIVGLTKSLAEEFKMSNIQVNSICPAFVDTDMAPGAFRKNAMPPEKISDLAIFLASNKSDYITGEAIKIFGKQDMYWFGSQQTPAVKAALNKK